MTAELAKALVKAQSEMDNAALNKTNPHFKSKYADFVAIREATLPVLTKNGLAVTQYPAVRDDGTFVLRTRLMHESGEFIEGEYPIAIDKPQAMGSALTYARRYSWSGITGIAADEDDDGQAARNSSGKPKTSSATPTAPAAAAAPKGESHQGKDAPSSDAAVPDDVEITRLRRRWNALAKGKKKTEATEAAAICDRWNVNSLDELDAGQWECEIELFMTATVVAPTTTPGTDAA